MKNLELPRQKGEEATPILPQARQLTIVGAPGAGKTRFMEEMVRLSGNRAFCLSAISAPYPERVESRRYGSIDSLYREAIGNKAYMRTDAVSELDKLVYLLIADEFDNYINFKEKTRTGGKKKELPVSKIDRLSDLWEKVFPGNGIVRSAGTLLFSTQSGDDLIEIASLSQSEQTVLYYGAAVLYAMQEAVIFIDSPSLFLHPTILDTVWNNIESLRPDCRFVYNSVDVSFVGTRTRNVSVWVKSYEAESKSWEYEVLKAGELHEQIFVDLIGSRRPVLFIEGDSSHSIDNKLYPLIFPDWTVKPLGSCNRVIETTRTFKDQKNLHHLESCGIVDRDRRTDSEVEYLRRKGIMVPEVAEIENLFLLEEVIRTMAKKRGINPNEVFSKVRKRVISDFSTHFEEQALQHVRHRVKREVEYKIDRRFSCITAMETHLKSMFGKIAPRAQYNKLRNEFKDMIKTGDYNNILKVFNHKPLLVESGVSGLLGYNNKDEYINGVISVLKADSIEGITLREAIKKEFEYTPSKNNESQQ